MKRANIGLQTKLASALLELDRYQNGVLCIPYEHTKAMSAEQICSLWAFDHWPIRKADGGSDHPSNLMPRLIAAHREKTAKIDVPEMAKSKRIRRKEAVHAAHMSTDSFADLDRAMGFMTRKRRIPSRPFSKIKRPIRSIKRGI